MPGTRYFGFVDPSGGSVDSFTLAIGHRSGVITVLDAVREVKPPFSPESVVSEFARTLKSYRVSIVTGDKYGGEWPREQFLKLGIRYEVSSKSKSDLYRDFLPLVNSRQIDLLDHARLVAQLCALERRTARGGRDTVDHPPGGHDDVSNVVAGLTSLFTRKSRYMTDMLWVDGGADLKRQEQLAFNAYIMIRRHAMKDQANETAR